MGAFLLLPGLTHCTSKSPCYCLSSPCGAQRPAGGMYSLAAYWLSGSQPVARLSQQNHHDDGDWVHVQVMHIQNNSVCEEYAA